MLLHKGVFLKNNTKFIEKKDILGLFCCLVLLNGCYYLKYGITLKMFLLLSGLLTLTFLIFRTVIYFTQKYLNSR